MTVIRSKERSSIGRVVVDVHAHFMPAPAVEALARSPERFDATLEQVDGMTRIVTGGRSRELVTPEYVDVERRVVDMDNAGIDVQVLSPRPNLLCYWADAGWAAEFCAEVNEGMAAVARDGSRFWALGQLPLQSPELSLQEIDHVVELGLVGVEIGATVEDVELDDETLDPVWTRLAGRDLAVFVHPVNRGFLPRMADYHLTNIVGNPLSTTLAISRLVLGGVLTRHPGLRFCFAHGGGCIPYLAGRMDHAYEEREDTSARIDVTPSSLLSRCYFDTITHAESSLRFLIDSMGDGRVVVGTDYPADMAEGEISSTLAGLGLSDNARRRIECENAERLFQPAAVKS